jgi:hypothetical protein
LILLYFLLGMFSHPLHAIRHGRISRQRISTLGESAEGVQSLEPLVRRII